MEYCTPKSSCPRFQSVSSRVVVGFSVTIGSPLAYECIVNISGFQVTLFVLLQWLLKTETAYKIDTRFVETLHT